MAGPPAGGQAGPPRHRMNIWQGAFPARNTGALAGAGRPQTRLSSPALPAAQSGGADAGGGDGWRFTAPPDAFLAQNGLGLRNMLGNVWEWVRRLDEAGFHSLPLSLGPMAGNPQTEVRRGGWVAFR